MSANVNSSLQKFVDFQLVTRQKLLSSPDTLVNQATKYRTNLISRMMKGLTAKEMIQSGTEIVDFVQLKTTSSFGFFNPTDTFNYTGDNSLTQISVPWRFAKVYSVTYEHELDLNQGGEGEIFKRLKNAKNAVMEQSFWEGMEDALWATPNFDTMEGTLGQNVGQPLSLRCFITDDGGAPTASNGGSTGATASWTSVMGVSPSTYTNWKNQYETFDNTSAATRRNTLIEAMDAMWLDVQWESPSTSEEYFKSTNMSKLMIVCNKTSYLELVSLATAKNNVLTPKNDLGYQNGTVVYHGIPIKYVAKLDTIDTTHAAYTYRFINFNHIKPIFNSKHFRRKRKYDGGANNPNAMVVLEDTWLNLWNANRREHGIVRAA
jgi:hypothetical protein